MTVEVKPAKTLKEFLRGVVEAGIRRVLLTDHPTAELKRKGESFALIGMLEIVATALDRKRKVIHCWSEKGESARMAGFSVGSRRGRKPAGRLITRKEQVFQLLREEGLEVDEGEWTPPSAEAYLTTRRSMVG